MRISLSLIYVSGVKIKANIDSHIIRMNYSRINRKNFKLN